MLAAKPLKSTEQASHYFFEQDNYYLKDAKEIEESTQWSGKGTQLLGLSGHINPEDFRNLLEGKLPTGQQLGKIVEGQIVHRPGFDLTFSAPKSVSILTEIGQDHRLQKAHKKAVQEAMQYVERQCAQARITKNKKTSYENTGNLIAAQFKHDTSRLLDPHTHTHCVVMNATLRSDGQWRAMASGTPGNSSPEVNGFLDRVFKDERAFGAIYRACLAYEVAQLGYTVRKTHADGRFEIGEVPENVIEHFSKRREEIETEMEEKGASGARAAAFATLATRQAKKGIDRGTLHADWKEQEKTLGFDSREVVEKAIEKQAMPEQTVTDITASGSAIEAVNYAIDHLSERNTTLSQGKLLNTALTHALGEVRPGDLLNAIESAVQDKTLIPLPKKGDQEQYTTTTLLGYEQTILDLLARNTYAVAPISDKGMMEHPDIKLSPEQTNAVNTLLKSPDRYTALIGISGTGKTRLLPVLAHTAEHAGLETIILTPSSAAQKRMSQTGCTSYTLSRFLKETERDMNLKKLTSLSNHVLILDDAQMIGAKQTQELMTVVEKLNTRLIPIGDVRAYLPSEGGSPLAHLQAAGMQTATLHTIERQKNEKTKAAIHDTLAGRIEAAFEKIGDRIQEVEKTDDRFAAMAKQYVALSDDVRADSLVLVPSNTERAQLTALIREGLKETDYLAKTGVTVTALVPKILTHAQTTSARHYAIDDEVRFNQSHKDRGIKAQTYYRVIATDRVNNQVSLQDANKRTLHLNLNLNSKRLGSVEVFEPKIVEVCQGDRLRWSRQNPQNGLFNGEIITVSGVSQKKIQIQRENGEQVKLDMKNTSHRHFDHGYVVTPYQSYHQQPQLIIAHQSSKTRQTSQRSFYKHLSQAREAAFLYTDQREQYCEAVKTVTGDRISAIEAVLNEKVSLKSEGKTISENVQAQQKKIEHALPSVETLRARIEKTVKTPDELATIAVKYAIAHLSEREATFTHLSLFQSVIGTNLFSAVAPEHIEKAIKEFKDQGILHPGKNSERWTTSEAIALETEIIKLAQSGKDQHAPIASKEIIDPILTKHGLNPGQRRAASLLTQTTDTVALVQGLAGTGKTTMLTAVKEICDKQNYTLQGLAPTHTAVHELSSRELTAQTVHSFLWEFKTQQAKNQIPDYSRTILVVDEASMSSNQIKHDLLSCIKLTGARVVPIGDARQLSSPSAGKPFTLLQKKQVGISTATMDEILRQETPALKNAVKAILKRDFSGAMQALNKQSIPEKFPIGVIELQPLETRENPGHYLDPIVENFMSRTPEERAQTLIITPSHKDREDVNDLIRFELKKEGTLPEKETELTVLRPRDMTQANCSRADQYHVGDVVRFNAGFRSIGIEKNSYLTVQTIDAEHNLVVLKNDKDELIGWQPHRYGGDREGALEVYKRAKRQLCVGEKIRWTRSDKASDLFATDIAEVLSVQDQSLLVKLSNGTLKTHNLNQASHQHFDYAYASTTYAAQGKTIKHVITYENSKLEHLTNQSSFYVAVTRAKQSVTVYTNNCGELLKQLNKNTGEKTSALELIEHPLISALKKREESVKSVEPSRSSKTPAQPKWDVQDILQHIDAQAESLVEKLLGKPNKITPTEYRYGSRTGSFVVTLKGQKRGLWHDFQTGEGGNLLSLISKTYGHHSKQDFQKTLQTAAQLLGISPRNYSDTKTEKITPTAQKTQDPAVQGFDADQKRKIAYARQLEKESLPISGTLAERYLREHRGLSGSFPDTLRFHPKLNSKINRGTYPALLVIAQDKDGKTQAVQAIYLDKNTANKAQVEVKKQVFGIIKGALVTLQKGNSQKPTLIAEGPETGLSLRQAMPNHDVKVTLGVYNYRNIQPTMVNQKVILCLDNDGQHSSTQKAVQQAIEHLQKSGKEVYTNQPDAIKTDYNDMLKSEGIKAIQSKIESSAPATTQQTQTKSPDRSTSKNKEIDHAIQRFELKDTVKPDIEKSVQRPETVSQEKKVTTAIRQELEREL